MNKKNTLLLFNPRFYSVGGIKQASEEFNDVMDVSVTKENDTIRVCITPKKGMDITELADEFCNAVLLSMKNMGEL